MENLRNIREQLSAERVSVINSTIPYVAALVEKYLGSPWKVWSLDERTFSFGFEYDCGVGRKNSYRVTVCHGFDYWDYEEGKFSFETSIGSTGNFPLGGTDTPEARYYLGFATLVTNKEFQSALKGYLLVMDNQVREITKKFYDVDREIRRIESEEARKEAIRKLAEETEAFKEFCTKHPDANVLVSNECLNYQVSVTYRGKENGIVDYKDENGEPLDYYKLVHDANRHNSNRYSKYDSRYNVVEVSKLKFN